MNITSLNAFGYTTDSNEDLDNILSCGEFTERSHLTIDSCDLKNDFNQNFTALCSDKTNCTYEFDLEYINKNCTMSKTFDYIYISYICYDNLIDIAGREMTRQNFAFVVVTLDIASMTVLLIGLIIITFAQSKTTANYKNEHLTISDYTLHFTNLSIPISKIYDELDGLLTHLQSVMKIAEPDYETTVLKMNNNLTNSLIDENNLQKININFIQKNFIYDINYPMITSQKLGYIMKYNDLVLKKKSFETFLSKTITKKTKSKFSPTGNIDDAQKKYEKMEKQVNDLHEKIVKTQKAIRDDDKYNILVKELYVTFRNQKIADFYNQQFRKSKCTRCCYIFCCNYKKIAHLYYKKKWMNTNYANDEPSNINWQNVPYASWKRFLRKLLSYIIAIIVMGASFLIIIYAKYEQKLLNQDFNTDIDCTYIDFSIENVIEEVAYNIPKRDRINSYCYCDYNYKAIGYSGTLDLKLATDGSYICKDWINAYIKYNSLTILIIILIPIVNTILQIVLRILTVFEKNKTLTEDMISNMVKLFIVQWTNTGLIILLVNTRINSVVQKSADFFIFTGNYIDFDPAWYVDVGVTIVIYHI